MDKKLLGYDALQQRFAQCHHQQKLPHAWLFHGMRGIGKAYVAQQLAMFRLCEEQSVRDVACGQCHSCWMMASGTHPDFMRVELLWDDKNKRFRRDIGVDQVREALSFLSLSGMQGMRRIIMVDDADAMNGAAANALLKGLEEPSDGALILLVCHDLTRIPATIRSRCLLEYCMPLNQHDMSQVLESMLLSDEVLALALWLSEGQPGLVACLQDDAVAQACIEWRRLTQQLDRSDVGQMDDWLQKNIKVVPHGLMTHVIMQSLQEKFQEPSRSFHDKQCLLDAGEAILSWASDVKRYTLRPVPSLLARILTLRSALKLMV